MCFFGAIRHKLTLASKQPGIARVSNSRSFDFAALRMTERMGHGEGTEMSVKRRGGSALQ